VGATYVIERVTRRYVCFQERNLLVQVGEIFRTEQGGEEYERNVKV
jgi:hypothetical protein